MKMHWLILNNRLKSRKAYLLISQQILIWRAWHCGHSFEEMALFLFGYGILERLITSIANKKQFSWSKSNNIFSPEKQKFCRLEIFKPIEKINPKL